MLNQEDKPKPFLQNGGGPMNVPPRREPGPPVPCTRVTTELGVQVKRAESLHRKGECGSQNSGRSSRDGSYREKALEEIRNSLKPYATSDPHSEGIYEFSSASSSASESSGASQPPNSWGLLPNGLNQNLSMQQAYKQLLAMGHSEESAAYVLKMTSDDHLKEYEDSNHDQVNGVSKMGLSNTFKYKAQPKILDLQDSSSSSEYSAVVTSLRHKILPDPPKLIYANCENFKNKLTTDFSDVPPPLPPPRGTGACPPPTPPRHTPPPTTNGYKQSYLRRLSPVPTPSWQSRGTSPSRGNASLVVVNNSQIHQQLAQQLQALSVNGSTISSPSRSEYHSSQNGKSSWYSSSPQPSYASSSSGRHSPTPTLSSSSEYSLYQLKQAPPPAYTPPSSYSSSPQPPYRTGPLQPMSSRQAKSQSPIIMQSVKSTQVQKPVLQTAVAPTSPPPSYTVASPVFTSQQQTSAAPPPYPIHKVTSTASLNSSSSQENNTVVPQLREQSSNPPPLYPRNPKPHAVSHTDPPPYSVTQPSIPPSPTPPPYTNPMWQTQQGVSASYLTTSVNQNVVPELPASTAESLKYHPPQDHRIEILQPANWNSNEVANNGGVSQDISPLDNNLLSNVPTTDPPSYASSMAVLSAQRAAQRMTKLNNNNVPTLANNGPVKNACDDLSNSNLATTKAATSNLVNTVDSICTSQITALPGSYVNIINNGGMPEDAFSFFDNHHTTTTMLFRKPSPVAMDTASSASRSDSPVSRNINQSPVSFTSTMSTLPPSTQNESGCRKVVSHQSPPFPRKMLSKEKEKERRESKVRNYSPAAFKFFMEQHVENLLKSHQERETRRQQLESEMAKVGLTKEAQCEIRKMLHQKESNYIRLKRAKMNKSMFTKIKTIGIGAFGEVALVKKVDANQLYAMKTLRKSDVLKRNQVAHVKAERDILAEADNEWVVKLYYSFQDDENLYFVMDFIPGGDLMSLLIKYGVFTEQLARFYIAELVLAVESVHKMGFIHRDIKPDNILIDRDGHIKLTDFGLCTGFRWTHNSKYYQRNGEHGRQDSMDLEEKWSNECHCKPTLKPLERRRRREHQRCLAHSLVGTPNYIAPEVLLKTGYTQLCDWWSVGVILFEMLVGQPPFLANTPAETQYKVINWENTLRFPPRPLVADMAKELILKLCTRPEHRLGRNGVEEIKHHPFFHDIDLSSDLRKQPAPYVPSIRHPTDTSNFDPVDSEKIDESSCDGDMGNKQHPEHAFLEFTFRRFFDDGGHNVVYTGSRQPPIEEAAEKKSSPVYV